MGRDVVPPIADRADPAKSFALLAVEQRQIARHDRLGAVQREGAAHAHERRGVAGLHVGVMVDPLSPP